MKIVFQNNQMKRVKTSPVKFAIACLNSFLLLIDLFLLVLFLFVVLCFFWATSSILILIISNKFILDSLEWEYLGFYLESLSLSLTGVLIPVISVIFSVLADERQLEKRVSELLAEGNNVRLYLIELPLGAWHNLISAYTEKCRRYQLEARNSLSDYPFALHLIFRGNNFQAFHISVLNIGLEVDSNEIQIWKMTKNNCMECITSDLTGVEQLESAVFDGTNITSLLHYNDIIVKYLCSPIMGNVIVNFDLRFDLRKDRFILHWKQFTQCIFFFPILRSIYAWLVFRTTRYSMSRYSLRLNKFDFTDERKAQLCYNIYDVNVENKRGAFKHKRGQQPEYFWKNEDR